MTLGAMAYFPCPPKSVSRTERTGTRLHGPSVTGSAAFTPLMRAGMPADHEPARTGELPVSGPIRQLSRSGRSLPHCQLGSADPNLGAPAPSPAQHAPLRGLSGRTCRERLKRWRSHPDATMETLPARAPALAGMPAQVNLRCPARSVSRTERTGTRPHGPSVTGSAAFTR